MLNQDMADGHTQGAMMGDPAWQALVEDSERPVVVVNPDGAVVFANSLAARHIGLSNPSQMVGRRMEELCDAEYARERLDLIREVAERGEAVAIEGMTRGVYRRTIMRPIEGDGERRVLMVHVPARRRAGDDGVEVRRARHDDLGPLKRLTSREMEVLRLIAEGLTTAEIADRLHRSVKTVEWHRVSLGNKLGVSNRVELARIAIRCGLVSLEDADTTTPDA